MEIGTLVNSTWTMTEIGDGYIPISSYFPMLVITGLLLIVIGLVKFWRYLKERMGKKGE